MYEQPSSPGRHSEASSGLTRRGRPPIEVRLTGAERSLLSSLATSELEGTVAIRCRIVLACDAGLGNKLIAAELGIHPTTVAKWRHRFASMGLDGLTDAKRSGRARRIDDDVVQSVIADTLATTPSEGKRWSTRALAARHGISHQTVAQIWRSFGLQPWTYDRSRPGSHLALRQRDGQNPT